MIIMLSVSKHLTSTLFRAHDLFAFQVYVSFLSLFTLAFLCAPSQKTCLRNKTKKKSLMFALKSKIENVNARRSS